MYPSRSANRIAHLGTESNPAKDKSLDKGDLIVG